MRWPLLELFADAFAGIAKAQRLLSFWGPVIDVPAALGPLLAITSVVTLALLSGIAVGTLAVLIFVLLALYLLLTEVFGVSLELIPA